MGMWMLACFALLCIGFIIDKCTLRRARASFRYVIHVNGIRGKTTVCRMLDAALRGHYRVYTKTTGSTARTIHVSGQDRPLRRLGPANIREQARALRQAYREKAEVVILECMAVQPALQETIETQLLQSDIAVITNVRLDHIFEMGRDKQSIAAALAGVMPTGGTLYTADAAFFPYFEKRCAAKGSKAVLCADADMDENTAIVHSIATALGLAAAEIQAGLAQVQPDIGMAHHYRLTNTVGQPFDFLNLFAANDPESARQLLDAHTDQYESIIFLYNNRDDRPDRLLLFAEHFFPHYPGVPVWVMGESKPLARRLLRRHTGAAPQAVRRWADCLQAPGGSLLVGLGNIKGEPQRMLAAAGKAAQP